MTNARIPSRGWACCTDAVPTHALRIVQLDLLPISPEVRGRNDHSPKSRGTQVRRTRDRRVSWNSIPSSSCRVFSSPVSSAHDWPRVHDRLPAWLPWKPRSPAPRKRDRAERARMAGSVAADALALSIASAGYARDRLPGDVQWVKMIGFTVADVGREADFFTKVLQFDRSPIFASLLRYAAGLLAPYCAIL
jgi:hypothetical protein